MAIELGPLHAHSRCRWNRHTVDGEDARQPGVGLVGAVVAIARPASVALMARRPAHRHLAWPANVDELVQLGGALCLELGQARAVDSTGALGRHPVEEAAIDALALLLSERLLGGGESAAVLCPLVEGLGVLELIGLWRVSEGYESKTSPRESDTLNYGGHSGSRPGADWVGDVELVEACRILECSTLGIAVALAVAGLEE